MPAKCCGLPYWYKNTTTIKNYLEPLKKGESVKPGDIIWFQGYVLVVSNFNPARVIEARGYTHGFGKLHELSLGRSFKGIGTIADLQTAYHSKQPVKRLNKEGTVQQTIPFLILKLDSVLE